MVKSLKNTLVFSVVMLFACLGLQSLADTIELGISDNTLQLNYGKNITRGLVADFGGLYAKEDGDKVFMADAGLFVEEQKNIFQYRIGGKLFAMKNDGETDIGDFDGRGLALGGMLDAEVYPKLMLIGTAYYAPDITTGGDFDQYLELEARAAYRVMGNADVFAGYQMIEVKSDDCRCSVDIYDGFLFGFRMIF